MNIQEFIKLTGFNNGQLAFIGETKTKAWRDWRNENTEPRRHEGLTAIWKVLRYTIEAKKCPKDTFIDTKMHRITKGAIIPRSDVAQEPTTIVQLAQEIWPKAKEPVIQKPHLSDEELDEVRKALDFDRRQYIAIGRLDKSTASRISNGARPNQAQTIESCINILTHWREHRLVRKALVTPKISAPAQTKIENNRTNETLDGMSKKLDRLLELAEILVATWTK